MKRRISSALYIILILTFSNVYSAFKGREVKSNCATQLIAMGLMRKMQQRREIPITLNREGAIPQSCILRLNDVGPCSLYYKNREFSLGEGLCSIPRENIDDVLGKLDDKTIGNYLALAKIGVSKGSDSSLILRSCIGGKGGGPLLAYWGGIAFDGLWSFMQWKIASRALNRVPDIADGAAEGAKELKKHVSKFVGEMTDEDRFRGIGNVRDIANNLRLNEQAEYEFLMSKGMKDAANAIRARMEEEGMKRYTEIASEMVKEKVKSNTKSYVAEKLKSLPHSIKESIEKGIGGNIFSERFQSVATGAFKQGAMGAAISVGFQVGSNIISNLSGPDGGTAKIIGGVAGASAEPIWGDWLDRLIEPSGLAAVAMNGFWYGGLRYTAKTLVTMGLAALPGA